MRSPSEGSLSHLMWAAIHERGKKNSKEPFTVVTLKTYNKIESLSKELFHILDANGSYVVETLDGSINRGNYKYESEIDGEVYEGKLDIYSHAICHSLAQLIFACRGLQTRYKESFVLPKGRPPNSEYKQFISRNIELYESLSKKLFTLFRHKSHDGSYAPVTEGHGFAWAATQLLNQRLDSKPYTDKNIYNACEESLSIHRRTQ